MTVRQKFEEVLFKNGMFESQAQKVMDAAIPSINRQLEILTGTKVETVQRRSKYNRRKRKRLGLGEFSPIIEKRGVPVTPYSITWDRPAEEYPTALYATLYTLYVKPEAYKWIEENLPMAWYKQVFAPDKVAA